MSEPQTKPQMTIKQELMVNLLTKTDKSISEIAKIANTSRSRVYYCADTFLDPDFVQKRKKMIAVNKMAAGAGKGPVLAMDSNNDLVQIIDDTKREELPCQAEPLPCPAAVEKHCEEPRAEEGEPETEDEGCPSVLLLSAKAIRPLPTKIKILLSGSTVRRILTCCDKRVLGYRKILYTIEKLSINGLRPSLSAVCEEVKARNLSTTSSRLSLLYEMYGLGFRGTRDGRLIVPDWYKQGLADGGHVGCSAIDVIPGKREPDESTEYPASAVERRQDRDFDDGHITIEYKDIKISWTEPEADKRTEQILKVLRELRS